MINKITSNLMVKNVAESVTFYTQIFGFEIFLTVSDTKETFMGALPEDKNIVFAFIKFGAVEIMLQEEKSMKEDITALKETQIGSSISLFIQVEGLKKLYQQVKGKVTVVKEYATAWYGSDEFYIQDNNGYILGFYEPLND